jgi:hypothetical protein
MNTKNIKLNNKTEKMTDKKNNSKELPTSLRGMFDIYDEKYY